MLQHDQSEALTEVFCSVLETLAFMFGDQVEKDELPPESDENLAVKIRFKGPNAGELTLIAPADICLELAANILGVDDSSELADAKAHDALKELVNVTCGQLLTTIFGEEPVFDLTVPEVQPIDGPGWRELLTNEESVAFNVEENLVMLHLTIDA